MPSPSGKEVENSKGSVPADPQVVVRDWRNKSLLVLENWNGNHIYLSIFRLLSFSQLDTKQ